MPYRKTWNRRPRRYNNKKKTHYRRRRFGRLRRAPVTASTGSLTCKQKVLDTAVAIPAGPLPTGFVSKLIFELDHLQQYSTFSSLFDQYRINAVKIQMLPTANTNDQSNAGGMFVSSIDLDDDTTITTFSDLLQCSNAKASAWSTAGGMTPYKQLYVRPRVQNLLNSGNVDGSGNPIFTTSLLPRGKWIDMGDRGQTKHYGINIGWDINGGLGLNSSQNITIIATYYLQFRKVR